MPDSHMLAVRAPADTVTNAVQGASTSANNAIDNTRESLADVIKTTGTVAMNLGSQTTQSLEDVAKTTGQTLVALLEFLSSGIDVAGKTVSTGGEYLSSGVSKVDSYLNNVPVVRMFSGGLNNLLSGITSAFGEATDNGRRSRQKMFRIFRNQQDSTTSAATNTIDSATQTNAGV